MKSRIIDYLKQEGKAQVDQLAQAIGSTDAKGFRELIKTISLMERRRQLTFEENGYLSNWYLSHFTVNGIDFSSMEQFMMYQKAYRFHDEEIANNILHTDNVAEIKKLGRKVHAYDENVWNGVRQIIVYEGLKAKFSQNADLKRQLVDTGDAVLAECAVRDQIWGIGLSMGDPNRFERSKWKGYNLLGYALMLVREQL